MNLIDSIVKNVHEKFGNDSLKKMYDFNFNVERISTQMPSLDTTIGGGIPLGGITEIIGNEGAGKTTLGLHILSECLNQGGVAVYIDVEHSLKSNYIEKIIENPKDLMICQPRNSEHVVAISEEVMLAKEKDASNKPCVIVIDSVAALATEDELRGDFNTNQMAHLARFLSLAIKRLNPKISLSKTAFVCLNQMRSSIGFFYSEKSAGGKAIKFYAMIRLQMSASSKRMGEDGFGSQLVKTKTIKNKTHIPLQESTLELVFGEGFDT